MMNEIRLTKCRNLRKFCRRGLSIAINDINKLLSGESNVHSSIVKELLHNLNLKYNDFENAEKEFVELLGVDNDTDYAEYISKYTKTKFTLLAFSKNNCKGRTSSQSSLNSNDSDKDGSYKLLDECFSNVDQFSEREVLLKDTNVDMNKTNILNTEGSEYVNKKNSNFYLNAQPTQENNFVFSQKDMQHTTLNVNDNFLFNAQPTNSNNFVISQKDMQHTTQNVNNNFPINNLPTHSNNFGFSQSNAQHKIHNENYNFSSNNPIHSNNFNFCQNDMQEKIPDAHCGFPPNALPIKSNNFQPCNANFQNHYPNFVNPYQMNYLASTLPPLSLSKFSGIYSEWPSWRDTFVSMIDSSFMLNDIQKFHYLKTSLSGEPAALLSDIPVTSMNYAIACKKLSSRYERPEIIVESLINQFVNIPHVKSNNSSLRKVVNDIDSVLRSLDGLGPTAISREPWLTYLIKQKLDDETRKIWANKFSQNPKLTLNDLLLFMEQRSFALEMCSKQNCNEVKNQDKVVKSLATNSNNSCFYCKKQHWISQCKDFKALSVEDRRKQVSNLMLCFNCLRKGHSYTNCTSEGSCFKCQLKHHTLLHQNEPKIEPPEACADASISTSTSNLGISSLSKGLLFTALVHVKNGLGDDVSCRVLLDPGSESSFITDSCIKKLQIPTERANVFISGVTGSKTEMTKYKAMLQISSIYDPTKKIDAEVLSLSKITSKTPSNEIKFWDFDSLKNKKMADPYFFKPADIDILLGAQDYFDIIRPANIEKLQGNFRIMNTIFGWVVGGSLEQAAGKLNVNLTQSNVDTILSKFWEIEGLPKENNLSIEEQKCDEFYNRTVQRTSEGRYICRLPFRNSVTNLGDSYGIAAKRLYSLEARFRKDSSFKAKYIEFMDDYLFNDHMVIMDNSDNFKTKGMYYLPHHGVQQPILNGTKVRVVFDASAKTSNNISLNDELMVGRKLQNNICSILLRFRLHKYVICTDIEKMFRQILVEKKDTNYLRVLWRWNDSDPIKVYRMITVPFGLVCSPYIAQRTIKRLIDDEGIKFPMASKILAENIYVDDVYVGKNDITEILQARNELRELLSLGGFNLKKWVANDVSLLDGIPEEDCAVSISKLLQDDLSVKSLGIYWTPSSDEFSYKIKLIDDCPPTKRKVLSELGRIYDPFGWISPFTIIIKQLFQSLWKLKLDWDEELPSEILRDWIKIKSELPNIELIRIPRWICHSENIIIHGFSDASEKSYGAVIYAVCAESVDDTNLHSHLLMSKTRVAPLVTVTIPKLELCGAQLLAESLEFVLNSLTEVNVIQVNCWCDSQIVLGWLMKSPSELKTFVANRVANVQRLIPNAVWRYVPTKFNPADLCSRGIYATNLLNFELWWSGPCWLTDNFSSWPTFDLSKCQEILPELKSCKIKGLHIIEYNLDIVDRFSDLNKTLRVTSRILRLRNSYYGNYSPQELNLTLLCLSRLEQRRYFSNSISRLLEGKKLKISDPLLCFNPFLDDLNILRIGGRITNSNLSEDVKHPILLSNKSNLSVLLIKNEHILSNHIGSQTVISNLRRKFWIIHSRNLVRKVLFQCKECFRAKPKSCKQLMGSLPEYRVTMNRPFSQVGVDYAGPFNLRPYKNRGNLTIKSYIALFICLCTKAVHLEIVSDVSTEACLAAISRFVSRRGRPQMIISDNGTNFIGAKHFLDKEGLNFKDSNLNDSIQHNLSFQSIEWKLIPARAPEFGGLWEAAIKSCKSCLLKCIGNSRVTVEEFSTLLSQIEAALNSRPLCYLSEDPDDINILTPGHFLIGAPLKSLPELEHEQSFISLGTRWKFVQHLFNQYWLRWSDDYMTSLQMRTKNKTKQNNVEVGTVGLIKDELLPPRQWRIGKIVHVHPGKDNLVRAISLKVGDKIFKRAINKFYPLPIEDSITLKAGEDVRASE